MKEQNCLTLFDKHVFELFVSHGVVVEFVGIITDPYPTVKDYEVIA